jgi:hypothetical protein
MKTSYVALVTLSLMAGCNLSSEVGSIEDDAGGAGGTGSATGGDGGSEATTTGGNGNAVTSNTTSGVTTGGGAQIQNAHVYINASTSLGWIDSYTVVSIYASLDVIAQPTHPAQPCETKSVASVPTNATDYVDLAGARATVTAPGFGTVDTVWNDSAKSMTATFSDPLPDGTQLEVRFAQDSALFAGEEVVLRNASMDLLTPVPLQGSDVFVYQSGTDWLFDWTSFALPYVVSATSVPTNPMPFPNALTVMKCAGGSQASSVSIPASVMGQLVTAMENEPNGAEIWLTVMLFDLGLSETPRSGNFLTTSQVVQSTRPVSVTH